MYKFLSISILILLFISCDTTKPTTAEGSTATPPTQEKTLAAVKEVPTSGACEETALIKDMRGTDGCEWLLELDDGTRVLPAAMPKIDFEFENNVLVKIGYMEVKDGMSACMAENKIVNITCIEKVAKTGGIRPAKNGCDKLNGPFDAGWMKDLVIKHKPTKIDRYNHLDGFAYYLQSATKSYLYDCTGALLCEVEGKASNDCTKKIKSMSEKFTIWVVNN